MHIYLLHNSNILPHAILLMGGMVGFIVKLETRIRFVKLETRSDSLGGVEVEKEDGNLLAQPFILWIYFTSLHPSRRKSLRRLGCEAVLTTMLPTTNTQGFHLLHKNV